MCYSNMYVGWGHVVFRYFVKYYSECLWVVFLHVFNILVGQLNKAIALSSVASKDLKEQKVELTFNRNNGLQYSDLD